MSVIFTSGIHGSAWMANKPIVHFRNLRLMDAMLQVWCAGNSTDIRFSINGLFAQCRGFDGVVGGRGGSGSILATHRNLIRILTLHCRGNVAVDFHVLSEGTGMCVTFLATSNPTIIRLITSVDMGMLFSVRAVCKSTITSVKLTLKRFLAYKKEIRTHINNVKQRTYITRQKGDKCVKLLWKKRSLAFRSISPKSTLPYEWLIWYL